MPADLDPTTLSALAALLAVAVLLGATDLTRLPLGIATAAAVLVAGAPAIPVAIAASAAFVAGNVWRALRARREARRAMSAGGRQQRDALARWLARNRLFVRSTFAAGLLPFIPSGYLFPTLGSVGAPPWYAAAGRLLGRTPLTVFSTIVFSSVATILLGGNRTAGGAALAAVTLLALALALRDRLDVEAWRRERTIRLRPRTREWFSAASMPGMGGGFAAAGFGVHGFPGAAGQGFPGGPFADTSEVEGREIDPGSPTLPGSDSSPADHEDVLDVDVDPSDVVVEPPAGDPPDSSPGR